MIATKTIMKALPMLASILGRKYGVKVEISGKKAYTDGNVIHLPALPLKSNETLLGLVRGFIDHESAHVRETDFDVLKDKSLSPLAKNIWNIFEDWRVENAISKTFPGCRANFDWLIDYEFVKKNQVSQNAASQILNYILLHVREWDVKSVSKNRDIIGKEVGNNFPNLFSKLNALLGQVRSDCKSSSDCMEYARKVVKILEEEAIEIASSDLNSQNMKNLKGLLNAQESELPGGLGQIIGGELEGSAPKTVKGLSVASVEKKQLDPLSKNESETAKRASTALRTRLESLLQSSVLTRRAPSRFGKLDTNRLYKLNYSPKIFLKNEEKPGLNTAIHILLDSSSSMLEKMNLAGQATYAIADSLYKTKGITIAVSAFPAGTPVRPGDPYWQYPTISHVLKYGQKMHHNFKLSAYGGTPLGEALWKVMQEAYFLKEKRKIILIITDGKPDSIQNTESAIELGKELGFEFYGIGIEDDNIRSFLPETSRVIRKIDELAPAMFGLLQNALLNLKRKV